MKIGVSIFINEIFAVIACLLMILFFILLKIESSSEMMVTFLVGFTIIFNQWDILKMIEDRK